MTNYPYHLSITSSISSDYAIMQKGHTDAICIIGFADCDSDLSGNVYRVDSFNEALEDFSGTTLYESTLLKGLIEAYSTGCRDIYLFPILSMDNYLPSNERDASFWTTLYTAYQDSLPVIAEVDDIDIIVPYDIDITEKPEFVSLLESHCASINGTALRLAFIPYNGDATTTFDGESFHTVLVNGIGTFNYSEMFTNDYSSHMAASFAGYYSNLSPEVPPDNRTFVGPIMFDSDYEDDEETLEDNQIVGFRKTVRYKRVYDSSISSTLSYTRAEETSDFKKLYTVHVIQRLLRGIEKLDLLGSAAFLAQDSLEDFFEEWVEKGYSQNIQATYNLSGYTLYVNLTISLPYPIGDVSINMTVGPFT